MIAIYSSWSKEDHDDYYSKEWSLGDWDWWDDFICSDFKQGWGYEELVESLSQDFSNDLSLEEIKGKYLN